MMAQTKQHQPQHQLLDKNSLGSTKNINHCAKLTYI